MQFVIDPADSGQVNAFLNLNIKRITIVQYISLFRVPFIRVHFRWFNSVHRFPIFLNQRSQFCSPGSDNNNVLYIECNIAVLRCDRFIIFLMCKEKLFVFLLVIAKSITGHFFHLISDICLYLERVPEHITVKIPFFFFQVLY